MDIRNETDIKSICQWILACCTLHNIVNRLRNQADEVTLHIEKCRRQKPCEDPVDVDATIWRESVKLEYLTFIQS